MVIRNLKIIVVSDVSEYRRYAREILNPDDYVLEIGCGTGVTTEIIAKLSAKVYAIDKSYPEIRRAEERLSKYKNIYLECIDAFDIRRILERVREYFGGRLDVILIDIGGVADPAKVVDLIWKYLHVFNPRIILVKNRLLKKLIEYCQKD